MSVSEASKQRYSTTWQQAAYLEAEWSDYILPQRPESTSEVDPLSGVVRPTFYQEIGRLVSRWVSSMSAPPTKCCDVGGATGRTIYELAQRLDSLSELVLAEPSPELANWASLFLLNPAQLEWVPVVYDWQSCRFDKAMSRPAAIAAPKRVDVCVASSEDVPRPPAYFHLVTCLNVVDRVPSPTRLVRSLREMLAPGGLLVVSSPLQFDERFTPDRERWVVDLNVLFSEDEWQTVGEASVIYDIRRYRREWIRYSSQVVAKVKR